MRFNKPKFWSSINLLSIFLLPLSLITFTFNIFKSLIIDEQKFKIPIICVGNIFIGGTGKTPLSIYIYNMLKNRKFSPAIVKKYYPSHLDEIDFTQDKVKHFFSDKKRSLSISKAEKKKNNVIIMDDGLQDFSIKKDLNILCFNSMDLIGNGFLLPAGPLRERLKRLDSCQIVVVNGKRSLSFEKKLMKFSNKIKIYQSVYQIKRMPKFKNKKIIAFAGIGNPEGFFSLLKKNGLKIKYKISFPDHYNYTKNDLKNIILRAKKENLELITTEKDYFRLKKLGFKKIQYVSIKLKITNFRSFEREVIRYL